MEKSGSSAVFTAVYGAEEPLPDYVIGVLKTLRAENAAIQTLLRKINVDAQSVNARRRYLPILSMAVTAHIKTLRQVFLPALLTPEILEPLASNMGQLSADIRSVAAQPLQRWQAAQRVVMRKLEIVKRTPPMKFAWRGNFDTLAAAIEQYIEEEHRVIFPIAANLLTPLKLLSLDIRYTREINFQLTESAI